MQFLIKMDVFLLTNKISKQKLVTLTKLSTPKRSPSSTLCVDSASKNPNHFRAERWRCHLSLRRKHGVHVPRQCKASLTIRNVGALFLVGATKTVTSCRDDDVRSNQNPPSLLQTRTESRGKFKWIFPPSPPHPQNLLGLELECHFCHGVCVWGTLGPRWRSPFRLLTLSPRAPLSPDSAANWEWGV